MEPQKLYIGQKPIRFYIIIAKAMLQATGQICLAGRGRNISRTVDIAEILKREGKKIQNITISSEQMTNRQGRQVYVSTIEITVSN